MNRKVSAFLLAAVAAVEIGATAAAGAGQGHGPHKFHGGPPGPPDPAAHVARMTEDLGLSAEQAEKVMAVFVDERAKAETYHAQMREADERPRAATAGGAFDEAAVRTLATTKAQAMAELEVGRLRARAQVYAVLTAEQRARVDAMEKSRPERRGPGGELKGGPRR